MGKINLQILESIRQNIFIYAPTTEYAKKQPNEIEKLYANLNKLCDQFEKQSTSLTIIAGDFNAKVGKSNQRKHVKEPGQDEGETIAEQNL